MKHTFLAKSSSGDSYDVVFEALGGRMTVECSCKAGVLQQQCKHKRALVRGDATMLFAPEQADVLKQVVASPEAQPLVTAIAAEEAALSNVEAEKTRISATEKAIKTRMSKLFSGAALG